MTIPFRAAFCLLFAASFGAACMPNPQSVKERRVNFDRDGLRGRLLLDKAPPDMKRVDSVFGEAARLMGYTLDPAAPGRGSTVTVTYYWSALKPIAEDYMVFVHGDAIGGKGSRIHRDHYPARGLYPTDVWQVGEVVMDRFSVSIPPGYGAPALGLYTGLYKGNYRVPLTEAGRAPGSSDNRSMAVRIQFN
ncbi:MAG: hypothetical protein AAFN74_11240 [Myxococcota bacterium]